MQVTRVSVGGETDMEKEENWERDWESSRTGEWHRAAGLRSSGAPSRASIKKFHPEQLSTVSENKNREKSWKAVSVGGVGISWPQRSHDTIKLTEVRRGMGWFKLLKEKPLSILNFVST